MEIQYAINEQVLYKFSPGTMRWTGIKYIPAPGGSAYMDGKRITEARAKEIETGVKPIERSDEYTN